MLTRGSKARTHAIAMTVGLVLALALPGGGWAQAIQGRVLGEGDEGPVRQALVHLLPDSGEGVLAGRVSGDGRFVMDLPGAGRYRVKVEAMGYAPLTTGVVEVGAGEMVTVEVRLRREPIALEPLEVVVERRLEPPFMREVRQRASLGFGRLITREDLQDRFGSTLEDVLSGVAGLRITHVAAQGEMVPRIPLVTARLKTTAGRTCYADLYLNGVRQFSSYQFEALDRFKRDLELSERVRDMFSYRADEIEAIEVYRGPAEVLALGVEPRLVLARNRRVRPVLALRGEIAGRTMEYPPPLIDRRPFLFRSSAWGWGAAAGVEVELGRGVALDLALTEERLRFGGYPTLDLPTKSTASSWRARGLRFGLSRTWGN